MDNPNSEKVAVVDEVREHFGAADAAILTEYRGLKVKELAGLRRSLRANGGEYKIYKNTLVRLAAKDSGLADLDEYLVGPTGITFVQGDAAAVAKVLKDFSRTNPLLVIKGGVLGDKIIDAREASALAELPSREVLLAQLAGAIAAPMQQFAGLLQALPRNLAYGLAALRDQRDEGAVTDTDAPATEADVEVEGANASVEADETAVATDSAEAEPAASEPAAADSAEATAADTEATAAEGADAPDATPEPDPSSD